MRGRGGKETEEIGRVGSVQEEKRRKTREEKKKENYGSTKGLLGKNIFCTKSKIK